MDGIRLNNPQLKKPEEVRNCPNCGAPLDLGSVRCRYCGTSFRNPPKLDWTFFDLRDM